MAARLKQLYDDDFYAWTKEQATALQRLVDLRPNVELDIEHLIEEVEDLGAARRKAVRGQVRRILEHLLKLEHSPATDPRAGWIEAILDARNELRDDLTPSLRRDVEASLPIIYDQARRDAAAKLRLHGEASAADALPNACLYTLERLLDEDWLPS